MAKRHFTACASCTHWEADGCGTCPLRSQVSESAHPRYVSDPLPQTNLPLGQASPARCCKARVWRDGKQPGPQVAWKGVALRRPPESTIMSRLQRPGNAQDQDKACRHTISQGAAADAPLDVLFLLLVFGCVLQQCPAPPKRLRPPPPPPSNAALCGQKTADLADCTEVFPRVTAHAQQGPLEWALQLQAWLQVWLPPGQQVWLHSWLRVVGSIGSRLGSGFGQGAPTPVASSLHLPEMVKEGLKEGLIRLNQNQKN